MSGNIRGAAFVPGLPHLLSNRTGPQWAALRRGYETLAKDIAALDPEVLVVYSTQWFSVLGTSFQAHPHPKGLHVDENWYDLGDLPFDFKSDVALSEAFAGAVRDRGFPTKTVNYDEFPIDTGTIVAMRFLNPEGRIPVSVVSSWVYADAMKSREIGRVMREEALRAGKRAVFVAVSLLSARYFTDDIDPAQDRISSASDDAWNRRLLGSLEAGRLGEAAKLADEFKREVPTDMQLNALHWLNGVLGDELGAGAPSGEAGRGSVARVISYGPIWGTGAAVIEFRKEAE